MSGPNRPTHRPARQVPTWVALAAVLLIIVLISAAVLAINLVAGQISPGPSVTPTESFAAATPIGAVNGCSFCTPSNKTTVVWYVGLGAGSQPDQVQAEENFVNNYNATNTDNIILQLEELNPGGNATDTWRTPFDAGGGPDIIGPVGIQVRAEFPSYWLGLDDLIARNHTDLSVYPPALLATFKNAAGQYQGLPYDEYPAFIFYDKDLFKAAGLPDLPTQVGEKYMGADWTWDELAAIAMQLTVDSKGRRSTDAGFNPAKIKTYGFDAQWVNDLRRFATPWGAGSYVAADGKTAQIPAVWEQAWKWYYNAIWTSHFAPSNSERSAADMGNGTTVATGRVAMDLAWTWEISSFGSDDQGKPAARFSHWDMGVLPSNNGVTTDPIDSDGFVLNKNSKNPDAAYKAMLAIMADPSLVAVYGAMPVEPSLQSAYLQAAQAAVDTQFASNPVTWSVLTEMVKYAASPTHQDPFPNYVKGTDDDQAFYTLLQTKGNLNLDPEIARFKATLQADFDAPG
jgi:multiple sugar transport system substrate-binding protein